MTDDGAHERYQIPHADDLFSDTWAEDTVCPNCGKPLDSGDTQCPSCRQWIGECGGSCADCPSPTCAGGRRPTNRK